MSNKPVTPTPGPTPQQNEEVLPPTNEEEPPIEENTETEEGNETVAPTTTKLDKAGVENLQKSLVVKTINGSSDGLYFWDKKGVSIDDVNNPYLIAFNLKKYIVEELKMTSWPKESTQTWKWDMCINKSCNGTSDYTKIFRVSKTEFNDYMHKTYNTTNNFNLLSKDEGKTEGVIDSLIVVDSGSDYYNLLFIPKSGELNKTATKLVDYKEDNNFLYIYDKYLRVSSSGPDNMIYLSSYDKSENYLDSCPEDSGKKCDITNKTVFNENIGSANTYKHTFKKVDGNYYWVSSVLDKTANQ